jgi:uncharacterized phage protein (TIGR02220 family)
MESRVKDGNYYVVQSFMVKDLQLKGLEKDLYAIIYGYSQAENQVFNGSLQYLADWTNSSKQGIMKALNNLITRGLLGKNEKMFNGVKFVEYYATEFNGGIKLSLTGGIKQSLPNNIDNNNIEYNNIIAYLNEKAGTNYKASTPKTQKLIGARIKEGFKLEDFKAVIDNKCNDWLNTEWQQYLRPDTLFGTKFESYLNSKSYNGNKVKGRNYTNKEINNLFDDVSQINI